LPRFIANLFTSPQKTENPVIHLFLIPIPKDRLDDEQFTPIAEDRRIHAKVGVTGIGLLFF
jgi:hypothetical protein